MKDFSSFTIGHFTNERLKKTLYEVIRRLPDKTLEEFPSIYIEEGSLFSEGAHWTPASDIVYFDPAILNKYSVSLIKGIIAHELAHAFHQHGLKQETNEKELLENEAEADETGKTWGFVKEVNEMRQTLGPPTCHNRTK